MKVMYSTLENVYSIAHAVPADIPDHAAVFLRVGRVYFRVTEQDGALCISVDGRLVVFPEHANTVRLGRGAP